MAAELQSMVMHKLARFFLALALAVALPVQASSAVMAGLCMASHHDVSAGANGDDGDHHQGVDNGHASKSHCAPCVGCCAATAISSGGFNLPIGGAGPGPVAAVPSYAVGFQPDGLDRPPLAL